MVTSGAGGVEAIQTAEAKPVAPPRKRTSTRKSKLRVLRRALDRVSAMSTANAPPGVMALPETCRTREVGLQVAVSVTVVHRVDERASASALITFSSRDRAATR